MNRSDWNSLRTGDHVEVHLPPFPAEEPHSGEVVGVTVRARGSNDVAIRLDRPPRHLVHPPLTTVHRTGHAATCWRCCDVHEHSGAPGS